MRALMKDISTKFCVPNLASPLCADESLTMTKMTESVIYEDNEATLKISMGDTDVHSPRTKFLGIKWHSLKDEIKKQSICVCRVKSALNWADIFTKPLPGVRFKELRYMIMGW